jgi:hypothetical protein
MMHGQENIKVYTGCSRINYKAVLVTKLYKYLQYGTSGNE